MSRELLVGLVTALVAVIATGAALWSSSPGRPAAPDAIELQVTDAATARAAGPARAPRTRATEDDADARDDDRPSRARQADQPGDGDRRAQGSGAATARRASDDDRSAPTRRSSDDNDDDDDRDDDDDDNGDDDGGDGDDD